MKEEVKYLWIDALTSGAYKQAELKLKDEGKFCCLGVLCDLYHKETGKGNWTEDNFFLGEHKLLPQAVRKWSGVESSSGDYGNPEEVCSLTIDNDNGKPFKRIAKIIFENF